MWSKEGGQRGPGGRPPQIPTGHHTWATGLQEAQAVPSVGWVSAQLPCTSCAAAVRYYFRADWDKEAWLS